MKLFHQIWPQLRPPHLNITTGPRQTRPPNQTIRTDHHHQTRQPIQIRSPHQITDHNPWLFSFQAAQHNQHSEMVQVRCIHYGLGQGGYIELWMNLAKHTLHTRSASSFRNFFRLNLTVVRLASGFPGLVRASPSIFHKLGSFAGVRSAVSSASKNRLGFFGFGFDSRKRFGCICLHIFQMDFATAAFVVVIVVFTTVSRLVAPNLNWTITLHLTVYALVKWSFHSQGSTRLWAWLF